MQVSVFVFYITLYLKHSILKLVNINSNPAIQFLFIIALSFCATSTVYAYNTLSEEQNLQPEIFVERLQKEAGFPLNKVLRIFKDRDGKIWFTGTTGLAKFDGTNYTYFGPDNRDEHGLPSGWVESITQDDYGRIWVGTVSGLFYLKKDGKKFILVKHNIPGDAKVLKEEVTMVHFDNITRTLFYASHYGLHSFNLSTGVKKFLNFFGRRDDYHKIINIGRGPDNALYFTALYDGFYRLDPESMKATPIQFFSKGKPLTGINFLNHKIDSKGKMWISTWGDGIFCVDKLSENRADVTVYKWYWGAGDRYMHNIVNQFTFFKYYDGEEQIAMATEENGLNFLNPSTGKITVYTHNPGNAHSLPDKTCTSILFDQNILWVGTFNGAAKIALHKQQFQKYNLLHPESKIFGNDYKLLVSDIISDPTIKGDYWFTTFEGGLGYLQTENHKLTWYFQDILLKDPNSLIMSTLYKLDNKTLIIGHDKGLILFDIQSRKFKPFPDPKNKAWGSVSDIAEYDKDTLLITIFGRGIKLLSKKDLAISDFLNDKISDQRIRYCYRLKPGIIGLSSMSDGVYLYNESTRKVEHYIQTEKGQYYFPFTGMYNFTSDATGAIWCASAGGLAWQNPDTKKFITFKTHDGFPDDWVIKVETGNDNQVWALTRNGLGRIHPTTHKVQIFRYNQGFEDLQLVDMNASGDGNIWISAYNKLYVFNPANFRIPDEKPTVYLNSIFVNNRERKLSLNEPYAFDSDDQLIELKFATTYFSDPEMIRYQVLFIDNKDTLKYNQSRLSLSFLPAGNYRIQVNVLHANGYWISQPLFITFQKLAPWYQRAWFYALSALTLTLLLWMLFRYRLYRLRKKALLEMENSKKLNAMEMKVLRAQINPHFIFNSLNSIQKYVLSNDVLKASDYLGKFSRMIRMVLENSIENNTTLQMEKNLLQNYLDLEQMRTNFKFSYTIEMDPNLKDDVLIPSMLAQPYLENAIWHGIGLKEGSGHIRVAFEQYREGVKCIIEDDGVGRTRAAELKTGENHRSRGLDITVQRLKIAFPGKDDLIATEDIKLDENAIGGTRVIIFIPVYENKVHTG